MAGTWSWTFTHHVLVFNRIGKKEMELHRLAWPQAAPSHERVRKLKYVLIFPASFFHLYQFESFVLASPISHSHSLAPTAPSLQERVGHKLNF